MSLHRRAAALPEVADECVDRLRASWVEVVLPRVLARFDAGLRDAGHTNEIVDLYAIGFDPILRPRDTPGWLTETIPDDMLERMRLRESLLGEAGGPLKRLALKRLIGDRDARGVEHEYFYAVHGADDATRQGYLEKAYAWGRQF